MPAKRAAADMVDEILEFLRPGKLRDPEEVAKAVDLPEAGVKRILDILMQINLVEKGVRITSLGRDFLKLPSEKREQKTSQ
jgi:predicted transcriptional regulator